MIINKNKAKSSLSAGQVPPSMIKDIIIEVPLVDQYRDTEDISWAPKTCGICAIKMLMAFFNKKFSLIISLDNTSPLNHGCSLI